MNIGFYDVNWLFDDQPDPHCSSQMVNLIECRRIQISERSATHRGVGGPKHDGAARTASSYSSSF